MVMAFGASIVRLPIPMEDHTGVVDAWDEAGAVGLLGRAVVILEPDDLRAGRPKALVEGGLHGEVHQRHELAVVGVVTDQDGNLAVVSEYRPALP